MRLLEIKSHCEFSLTKELCDNVPPHAILSHTWGDDDEEPTMQDLPQGVGKDKAGYSKLRFCAEQAVRDRIQYVWVDTCCIDKSNSTELAEAINSMFRWYREAAKCYVYLSDLTTRDSEESHSSGPIWQAAFMKSRWFTRGWTLQELVAPAFVDFFSEDGRWLGDKRSLEQQIHEVTRIPIEALRGLPLSHFSVPERISWAENRETKRKEDAAYSLMGIFDIHMTLIYGEGREKAFKRLQNKINKRLIDLDLREPEKQQYAVAQASRKRKRHPEEDLGLDARLAELEKQAANAAKENETLKLKLIKAKSENEILKAMSVHPYLKTSGPPLSAGPIKYSPTDFYINVLWAHENKTPSHRIVTAGGESWLAAGATWDYIIEHPLYKRGLVDVGDVCDRLKLVAKCDGEGPVFGEREIIDAIEQSVAAGGDELL